MIIKEIESRAKIISKNNNDINHCLSKSLIKKNIDITLSEGLILGLLKQKVRKYFVIFGHGSTDFGEILRIYEKYGVTKTFNFRNEVEMSHAATTLSWQYNEIPAVVTSIGPGALQAMAFIIFTAMRLLMVKVTTCNKFQKMNKIYMEN